MAFEFAIWGRCRCVLGPQKEEQNHTERSLLGELFQRVHFTSSLNLLNSFWWVQFLVGNTPADQCVSNEVFMELEIRTKEVDRWKYRTQHNKIKINDSGSQRSRRTRRRGRSIPGWFGAWARVPKLGFQETLLLWSRWTIGCLFRIATISRFRTILNSTQCSHDDPLRISSFSAFSQYSQYSQRSLGVLLNEFHDFSRFSKSVLSRERESPIAVAGFINLVSLRARRKVRTALVRLFLFQAKQLLWRCWGFVFQKKENSVKRVDPEHFGIKFMDQKVLNFRTGG